MFNQVVLMGYVGEIYATRILVGVRGELIPVEMTEDMISKLLLNNQVGIKGHIQMYEDKTPHIICDELTILDRRGKKNGN